jgi:hypothetical protein
MNNIEGDWSQLTPEEQFALASVKFSRYAKARRRAKLKKWAQRLAHAALTLHPELREEGSLLRYFVARVGRERGFRGAELTTFVDQAYLSGVARFATKELVESSVALERTLYCQYEAAVTSPERTDAPPHPVYACMLCERSAAGEEAQVRHEPKCALARLQTAQKVLREAWPGLLAPEPSPATPAPPPAKRVIAST